MRIYELQARLLALNKRLEKDKHVSTNFINILLSDITHVQELINTPRIYFSGAKNKREISKIQRIHEGVLQNQRRGIQRYRDLYSSCSTWLPRRDCKEA